jgi:glucan phosphorylase
MFGGQKEEKPPAAEVSQGVKEMITSSFSSDESKASKRLDEKRKERERQQQEFKQQYKKDLADRQAESMARTDVAERVLVRGQASLPATFRRRLLHMEITRHQEIKSLKLLARRRHSSRRNYPARLSLVLAK